MKVTERFSDRVENYIRYRPGYPAAIIPFLQQKAPLTPNQAIADIGSGTGKLAELFLQGGHKVYGIEPNGPMRQAGQQLLASYPAFTSLGGRAENTGLPADSIDWIVAGQAFHWFDREKAKPEFRRILKPDGWLALVWNEREPNTSSLFLQAYEKFLCSYTLDYTQVDHRNIDKEILLEFYSPHPVYMQTFANYQKFDAAGLKGRYLSASYALTENHLLYQEALAALEMIFQDYQKLGEVTMEYVTRLYYGRL